MHYKREDKYLVITKENLPEQFRVERDFIYLKNSRAFPFTLYFPLVLNEQMAKIAAMILDGSLSKKLKGFMFCQKKDLWKVIEFSGLLKEFFCIDCRLSVDKGSLSARANGGKSLASFFYYCLDIHKSDEDARIPSWIWQSPKSVIKEYIRYAFAMEGSIGSYSKGIDVKFHSVDLSYLKSLQRLFKEKFDIRTKIYKYHIEDYGWKYFLYFSDQKNIRKFSRIGFALHPHQERLKQLVLSFKNKAWEITLVKILDLNKMNFTLTEVHKLFPSFVKRTVHQRLITLIKKECLKKLAVGYSLTKRGHTLALLLKDKVKITRLRTYPKQNEQKIVSLLEQKGESYRNEIARELRINAHTIGDTLQRLIRDGKIEYVKTDRFQRKFYKLTNPKPI